MKSILFTTDFTEISYNAAKSLFNIFPDNIHLTLLHAYRPPYSSQECSIELNDKIKEKNYKKLLLEKDRILKLTSRENFSIDLIVRMGSIDNVVQEVIKERQFDILAMGKNGGDFIQKISDKLKDAPGNCALLTLYRNK